MTAAYRQTIDINILRADRDALRVALRIVVDKAQPIPSAEPGEKPVGVAAYLEWREWDAVTAALGGWQEEEG